MPRALAIALAVFVLMACLLLAFAWPDRRESIFFPMGPIPVKVIAFDRTFFQFRRDAAAVRGRVDALVRIFNRHDPKSELSRVNREAAGAPVAVSTEMAGLVERSREWQRRTWGAFDPTVGSLVDLWEEAAKRGAPPMLDEIEAARRLVGLPLVEATADGRIRFARPGMGLDFGAIAKGAIADAAAVALKARGVRRGVVAVGGDCVAFGPGAFPFGIQDPTAKAGRRIIGTVDIAEGAVSTSGNYERFIDIGGKRYTHVIDPRTGMPVENGLVSVTVVGKRGVDVDAMATALMVLGRDDAAALLRETGFQALLIEAGEGGALRLFASRSLLPSLRLSEKWEGSLTVL